MDLTIVVVTHQSAHALDALLDSLGSAARSVLAVDNASRDETVARLRARGVRTLCLPENVGFAAAANLGARAAETRQLCFLNPDCEPDAELLVRGLHAIEGRMGLCAAPRLAEERVVVEGRQPGYTRLKLLCDVLETCWGGASCWRALRRLPGHDDRSWFWPHGACTFVSRDTFLGIGGFDPRFFLYMEDVDFGRRLCGAGGDVEPLECTLPHRRSQGSRIPDMRHRLLLDRGRVRYAAIHYGPAFARLLAALSAPKQVARRLLSGAV